jgi:hypothetical protein
MLMAKAAWTSITAKTIENCWTHTGIQCPPLCVQIPNHTPTHTSTASSAGDTKAWDIINQFASTDMTLPQAEQLLHTHFGAQYDNSTWWPILDAIIAAENDVNIALEAVKRLKETLTENIPALLDTPSIPSECQELEDNILTSIIKRLQERNRIFGTPPTLGEFVDPVEEKEIGGLAYQFDGDDEIVAQIQHEDAVKDREIIEVDSDEEDSDEPKHCELMSTEMIWFSEQLERACLLSTADCSLELALVLRCFWGQLSKSEFANAKQKKLTSFWGRATVGVSADPESAV